ncbi:MAG: DUF4115 domain-containing protein [Deltaproteobacteria bacterium]|nr:DUF4115 domain-containing protein [Deltaproteobacteria bacterium]
MKETGWEPNEPRVSFGSHLKAKREEKGLTLSDVSRKTRITQATLLLLEKEDWDSLPPPAFVKGFVKAYAEAIGADTEKILALYGKALLKALPPARKGFHAASATTWLIQLGVLAAFTLLVTVLVIMICLPGDEAERNPGAQKSMPPVRAAARTETQSGRLLHLRITAVSETWVRAMADGVEIRRFSLKPGQTISLTAKREFNLLVGSPQAVRLSLDGKPVTVAARAGQAVNVKLP